ncbi:MAG: hypothetical protein JW809_14490 [Pirellulales bacterium]|nr:hypothetical protein [Pirellulales bacterium]
MAGPAAAILLREPMSADTRADVRGNIRRLASEVDGDDFWIQGRPFILTLGPEYENELEEYAESGVPHIIGWPPRDVIGFAAMCNDRQDHRFLAEPCLRFCQRMQGMVDFGGALLPPICGEVQHLFRKYLSREGSDWAAWVPHVQQMVEDLPGHLFAVPYTTVAGCDWIYHICDAEFLEAWLCHPHFHMIK